MKFDAGTQGNTHAAIIITLIVVVVVTIIIIQKSQKYNVKFGEREREKLTSVIFAITQ